MYQAKHVANSILSSHWDRDGYPSISPMKLQKLMYFLHGWHLAIRNQPAVVGGFDAWTYGPVNEETYHAFKNYRLRPILQLATELNRDGEAAFIVAHQTTSFYEVLDMVLDKYARLSALQLSTMTHSVGSPWQKTREMGHYHIDDDLIRHHYVDLAESASAAA